MTLAEMVAAVASNIGNRTDKNDAIKRWLNEAQRTLVSAVEVRALDVLGTVAIQADEEFVPLPADLRVLYGVRCDGRLLSELHPRELERLQPDTSTPRKGRPRTYVQTGQTIEGLARQLAVTITTPTGEEFTVLAEPEAGSTAGPLRAIHLFPSPDRAYTLTLSYNRWPRQLVNDTDVCEVPIPMVESILIQGATAQAFMHLQQYEDATYWQRAFVNAVREVSAIERKRVGWAPGRMKFVDPTVTSSDPAADPMIRRWY